MFKQLLLLFSVIFAVSACNLATDVVENTPIVPTPTIITNTPVANVPTPTTAAPSATPQPSTTSQPTLASCTPRADWTMIYTVVVGDTLSSIAARAGSSTRELADANCLANANIINVGQQLRVPRAPATLTPTPTATSTPSGPAIVAFTVSPNPANFNGTVTLTWQTRGASGVRVRYTSRTTPQTTLGNLLAANGTTTFSLGEAAIQNNSVALTLVLTDAVGNLLTNTSGANYTQTVSVILNPYPTVLTFTSNPTTVTAGSTATLSWTTQNAAFAVLYRLDASGRIGEQIGSGYSPNGSATVTIPTGVSTVTYYLSVADANGVNNDARLTLTVNAASCSFSTYIAETCPATQVTNIASAHQTFQSGRMVWRGDSRQIYVLYTSGSYQTFSDSYNGETITPQTPPDASLRQPLNGFGWLWQNNSTVRGAMGWATDAETGYNATYETTSSSRIYFTLPNNTVVRLDGSNNTWTTMTR
ncbi:MAG: LysM peptidoglycan-binding domain-containing protein [Anaerolineae bacterium]